MIATPVGLVIAGVFAAASALDLSPEASAAVMRRQWLLRGIVFALLALWAAYSLADLEPLSRELSPEEAQGPLYGLAAVALPFYAFAAVRYFGLYRRRPAPLPLAVFAAFTLLAEAMAAIAFGRNWHASWWEWHVLMAAAFGLVALVARQEYRRRRSAAAVFKDLYLEHTGELVDRRYAQALSRAVDEEEVGGEFSEEETRLLQQAAGELRRLDELFSPYLSPQLLARLREEPGAGELGGEQREVSVLFADLQGFTAFSERSTPPEVVAMLNAYWAEVVPVVGAEDGMIERFAGDAVMVVFNAAVDQAGPRAARGPSGARVRGRVRGGRTGTAGVAALPRRGEQRPGGDRQRRRARAAELHRDRRHDQSRGPSPGRCRAGESRDRSDDRSGAERRKTPAATPARPQGEDRAGRGVPPARPWLISRRVA